MPCKICNYNQVKDIDRALLSGVSPTALSRNYSFTASELEHHQKHLQKKMALAQQRFQAHLNLGLFCKLTTVMEMVSWTVRQAKQGEDFKLSLAASREFSRLVSLMDKMAAKLQFDPEFLYCLMASPEWDLQEDALLPHAFQALSKSRQTMKLNLYASCPEPEPQVPEPALDSKVKVLHPHRESKPGRLSLDRLSEASAPPAREPGQETSAGDSPLENLRDSSATKARNERQNSTLSSKLNNNLNKICSVKNFFRPSAD